ncbi:hypothetical protein PVAP13_7KG021245 [Panicum virgatum]|uniref:DUF4220 domain-containing protein n=1 Tax=Panicum virgatum TaxID=38727 RepID=A0A8T0QCX6_PANVG|nr:hypothetical protein PVAP13_7KG021245 [Panicum virgatum]KAG2570433.1 hypothetical protein PVAP13_7KG021245 [Panicum virgatum]
MAALLHLWNQWEVQILVLVSFALQIFLLIFGGMRWHHMSRVPRILLWLVYLLADSAALYILGHMSINYKAAEHQRLMAFWAPFLLVHLGGQDTITAYAMEDNQLWLRHLLTLGVQALGAAYVLYKYITTSDKLVMGAAILMFVVGVIKYGERIWALKSSNLENISNYLDSVRFEQKLGPYSARLKLIEQEELDDEVVLQGAHDLFYICMGQFVDYKVWPSKFQCDALKIFHEKGCMFRVIEMQLSLMYDIFYTKAAVIHTGWGRYVRALSLLSTVTALVLFQFSISKDHYNGVDAAVTYILLIGALILEAASVLMEMASTWTCATLQSKRWDWLHSLLISLRRRVKLAGRNRKWSGFIGQCNLLGSIITETESGRLGSCMISTGTKDLVLREIFRMVEACGGEDALMTNSGQCALKQVNGFLEDLNWGISFDERVLTWHYATGMFLFSLEERLKDLAPIVEATKTVSNYMMFLLVKHPYMLPGHVRRRLYQNASEDLLEQNGDYMQQMSIQIKTGDYKRIPLSLLPGAKLATRLVNEEFNVPEVMHVVFGVWVEMLCYAAHNCSRTSHARQLNIGGEFITVVWLLSTAAFNCLHCDKKWFNDGMERFFKPARRRNFVWRRRRIVNIHRPTFFSN